MTLTSGVWMLGRVATQVVAIFTHIRFVLHKRLGRAVAASEWTAGGATLAQIGTWISINLGLGILVLLVTLMHYTA